MGKVSGRSGHAWRKLRERLKRELPPVCCYCGRVIDLTLRWPHPGSWTLDHAVPLSWAPELAEDESNLRPAHFRCNNRRGNRVVPEKPKASRKWGA